MPRIEPEQLKATVRAIFEAAGVSTRAAQVVSDHLVESNLAGHDSHGVMRVSQYVQAIRDGQVLLELEPKIVTEAASGAVIDGQQGFGQVAAYDAMTLAIQKARQSATATVAVRNCYHSGRLASYTTMAADAGMVGLMMVNAGGGGQSVAPFGGLSRRLATNPISIAAPSSGDFPIVLDVATSVAPEGKIRNYHLQGRPVPDGTIIDAHGNPTTSAADFYASPGGALLPLGGAAGYKGFGLGLMIDILAGALSGAGCCSAEQVEASDGLLMIAIDVEQFSSPGIFEQQVRRLVDHVKSSETAPGFDEVFVPGELEHRAYEQRLIEGIQVDEVVWNNIQQIASELSVTPASFEAGNGHRVDQSEAIVHSQKATQSSRSKTQWKS